MSFGRATRLAGLCLLWAWTSGFGAEPGRTALHGHVPAAVARLQSTGRLPATNRLYLAIGLPLRNQPALTNLLAQLYDPASPNYHRYLTPEQFTEQFGPTEQDYQSVIAFAQRHGLRVAGTHANRVLLDVTGSVADIENAFHVTMRTYPHPTENRVFYAPDVEPSVETGVPILDVSGFSDYAKLRPGNLQVASIASAKNITPSAGTGPGGTYRGYDFRNAYLPGVSQTGAGQTVGLLEFDGFYTNDIANYETQSGLTNVPLQTVLLDGYNGSSGSGNLEVSLDIEVAIAMAPALAKVVIFEAPNNTAYFNDVLNNMAASNQIKQFSCSWSYGGSTNLTMDQIFQQMMTQGQSFFDAAGDSDAYTGSTGIPNDDPNITIVGGTTLTTTGLPVAWSSETVWNSGGGQGGSGGVSTAYAIPSWQTGLNMTANQGSTSKRNIPDVALTANYVWCVYSNGVTSGYVLGTSIAAPLWAGLTALVNQQAAASGKSPVGFLNPAIYAIGKSGIYNSVFHDITNGNNFSSSSPAKFSAVTGYDLCTGWGTPAGTNLINALLGPAITANGSTLLAESATPTNGVIDPGETVTVSFNLQNAGSYATSNLVAVLLPGASVLVPSGPQNYGALTSGMAASQPFSFTAAGVCGSTFIATLQLQDGALNLGTVGFALRLGPFGPSQNFDGVVSPVLPLGWNTTNLFGTASSWTTTTAACDTAPNSAFVVDSTSRSENALVSPAISIVATNALLGFRNNFSFEYGSSLQGTVYYDGGLLEIQIGGGAFTNILSAGGSFVSGGYNGSITASSDNPLGGKPAWIGSSGGWQSVTVKLPASAAGQNIRLRWNCATDTGNGGGGAVGWYVDTVSITDTPTNCLTVVTDVAASQSLATNSYAPGQNLVYTLTATNLGPQPAANVIVTDTVPANAVFVSASPGCFYSAGAVVCPAGMLPPNGVTNFTVTLSPVGGSVFTNLAVVSTVTPEITTANNAALLVATQFAAAGFSAPLAGQNIECGGNANFSVVVTGTPPANLQWSLDSVNISGATNASLSLTNVHLPNHTVAVVATNLYGCVTNSALLTVHDTTAPALTVNGNNPLYLELGNPFTDPGATATDVCAGAVAVIASGSVGTNVVGTNTLLYQATDGNGNTNLATRTVIVRDTTPPVISWSFTNLTLAASSNCAAAMPDVTGTNYLLAADLSGAVTVTQNPTNNFSLPLGTNVVVLTAADASGNNSYSTNQIVVQDETPPVILLQPQSQTNTVGDSASFSFAATACTPVTFQWYFNNAALAAQTNGSLSLSNLTTGAAGNYFAVATAAGGSSTSSVAALVVNLFASSVTVASSENPSGFKDSVNFTAAVTPTNAAGSVQFLTNGALFDTESLVAGQAASTNLASLPRGTNFITAIYSGDADDLPSTIWLAQIVTNHPPAVTNVFYIRPAGGFLDVAVSNLANFWGDADGDTVSLAAIGVSTNGVTVTNDAGTLVYFNSNNVADLFVCAVTDGWGGTNFQNVNISVVSPTIANVVANPDSPVALTLVGAPGYSYILETTTNLSSADGWQPVATNLLGTNGVLPFTDAQATNFPQRFYRLKLAQ